MNLIQKLSILSFCLLFSIGANAQNAANGDVVVNTNNLLLQALKNLPDTSRKKLFKQVVYRVEIKSKSDTSITKEFQDSLVRDIKINKNSIQSLDSVSIHRSLTLTINKDLSIKKIRSLNDAEKFVLNMGISNDPTLSQSAMAATQGFTIRNYFDEDSKGFLITSSPGAGADLYFIPSLQWLGDAEFNTLTEDQITNQTIEKLIKKKYISIQGQTNYNSLFPKDFVYVLIAKKNNKFKLVNPYSSIVHPTYNITF